MKKLSKAAGEIMNPSCRIMLFGFVCALLLCLCGFGIMLLPVTYERLEAVSALMSLACRILVLTVLSGFISDIWTAKTK